MENKIKINEEQINKLMVYMRKYNINFEWINSICNVKCLTDITVVQYNSLLITIENIVESLKKGLRIEII